MNKKTLIIGSLLVFAIAGLMLWGRVNAARYDVKNHVGAMTTAAPSLLTSQEKLFDFGTISMKNGTVGHEFVVTNGTGAPIQVSKVFTSCMCTTAYLETVGGEKGPFGMEGMGYVPPADDTIAPGEARTVRIVFDPNAHGPAGVGEIDRFIYLQDAKGGTLALEIKAIVTP